MNLIKSVLLLLALFTMTMAANSTAAGLRGGGSMEGEKIRYLHCAYGPDTCKQGFVWREAFSGDHVCVVPSSRERAQTDNRLASSRRQPGGGPYGPDTCKQGYVWREARPSDHVCVTPATRTKTQKENSLASSRRENGCDD